jgi:hypothetical protein
VTEERLFANCESVVVGTHGGGPPAPQSKPVAPASRLVAHIAPSVAFQPGVRFRLQDRHRLSQYSDRSFPTTIWRICCERSLLSRSGRVRGSVGRLRGAHGDEPGDGSVLAVAGQRRSAATPPLVIV